MKMKKIVVLFLLVFSFLMVSAQNKAKKANIETIKSDPTYYWGESEVMESQDEAIECAYANLYSNIAKKCKPEAIYVGKEEQSVQLLKIISTFSDKIKEKSSETPVKENFDHDEYSYLVYLPKTEFEAMCDAREKSINRLANRGLRCENEEYLQLEDALKAYYWGMMLCIAHPHGENIKIEVDGEQVQAYQWFVDRIDGGDGVLKSFTFNVQKEDGVMKSKDDMIISLNVRSVIDGSPISDLKFEYHNGQKYIPTSVNDGKAIITVGQLDKPQLNIKIEYEFKEEAVVDPEVNKVINTIKHNIKFKNFKHSIDLSSHIDKPVDNDGIASGGKSSKPTTELETQWRKIDEKFNVKDEKYLAIMQEVEKGLRERNYESIKHYFTAEGFGMLDTLSRYGKITVIGKQEYNFMKFGDQVICRDINMQFDFRNNVSFNRNVVFRFDHNTMKISSIAFRLSSVTEKDILIKNKWSEEARVVLVNFLEDYQTAYALKRFDYLESIYSDDALIIVGHVVKKTVMPDRAQFNLSDNEVSLMKYDKNTYFGNLSRTFKSQEYINIRFAETDFTRAPHVREIYGVRLLQEYYSATYGDIGYLFLLVDLTDDKPKIHVRAWQPDEVDLDKLMGIKDIRI